jgi:hypothetical protein
MQVTSCLYRCADATSACDVILLEQNRVEQTGVSRIRQSRSATALTYLAVAVAVAESNCRKLSAVRSAASNARAGPRNSHRAVSASTYSRSPKRHSTSISVLICRQTSSTQGRPARTIGSRVTIVARVDIESDISCPVTSPSPISSRRARVTLSLSSAVCVFCVIAVDHNSNPNKSHKVCATSQIMSDGLFYAVTTFGSSGYTHA